MRDRFYFHFSYFDSMRDLSGEEMRVIMDAIERLAEYGEDSNFADRYLTAVWAPIRTRIIKERENYEEMCERNTINGKKGGRPKKETQTVSENTEKTHMVFSKTDKNPKNPVAGNRIDKNRIDIKEKEIKEKEKRTDKQLPYDEIINYLNSKAGTSYKSDSVHTKRCINGRWAEGYRLDDFKKVIDKKCRDWLNDPDMAIFVRPITLFSTKFESYLNEPERIRGKPKSNTFTNFKQHDYNIDDLESRLDRQFANGEKNAKDNQTKQ